MIECLTVAERGSALIALPAWRFDEARNALFRHLAFADFSEAWGFMGRLALAAEKLDHHPEWTNVYNRVEIWLTTHDAGGVSQRDIALAGVVDRLAPAVV